MKAVKSQANVRRRQKSDKEAEQEGRPKKCAKLSRQGRQKKQSRRAGRAGGQADKEAEQEGRPKKQSRRAGRAGGQADKEAEQLRYVRVAALERVRKAPRSPHREPPLLGSETVREQSRELPRRGQPLQGSETVRVAMDAKWPFGLGLTVKDGQALWKAGDGLKTQPSCMACNNTVAIAKKHHIGQPVILCATCWGEVQQENPVSCGEYNRRNELFWP